VVGSTLRPLITRYTNGAPGGRDRVRGLRGWKMGSTGRSSTRRKAIRFLISRDLLAEK
jgi:hypothetical protein